MLPLTERWWNGFAFYPASGFMALSDHRLGESLLGTPLQWLGCSAITAYNVTLLATFPLCALTAHWLGFVLARRHDAAAICALAYAFSPYRVAHVEHLELLAAFGMPAALGRLHRYLELRERRWLVVYAVAVVLQGLCASYFDDVAAIYRATPDARSFVQQKNRLDPRREERILSSSTPQGGRVQLVPQSLDRRRSR